MDWRAGVQQYIRTEKEKKFEIDFLKDSDRVEIWENVITGDEYDGEQTYEVKEEDVQHYAEAALDPSPRYLNEKAAKASPYGRRINHPLFCVPIGFWCLGLGKGSWIRTAGAINPGQEIELFEDFEVGEVIRLRITSHDKWIRKIRHFVTYKLAYYNQRDSLKAIWWLTLIIPRFGPLP